MRPGRAAPCVLLLGWVALGCGELDAAPWLERLGLLPPWYERGLYAERVDAYAADAAGIEAPCAILLGDSIVHAIPEASSGPRSWVNRGIPGDRAWLLERRLSSTVLSTPCAQVVLMAGVNDVVGDGRSPEDVAVDLLGVAEVLVAADREVLLLAPLPVGGAHAEHAPSLRQVSDALARAAARRELRFLDLGELYADEAGLMGAEFSADGLHLHPDAYAPWVARVSLALEAQ